MMRRISNLIPPPLTNDERSRVSRLLITVVVITVVANLSIGIITLILSESNIETTLLIHGSLFSFQICAIGFTRRGYVQTAAYLFISAGWVILISIHLSNGGIANFSYNLHLLTIVISGMILGGRAAIVMGILNILTTLFCFILHEQNLISPPSSLETVTYLSLNYTVIGGILAVVIAKSDWSVRGALLQIRTRDNQLQQREQQLHQAMNATDQARQLQIQMADILESISDFVGIVDDEQHVTFINATGRRLIGIDPEENVKGTSIAQYHPAWAATIIQNEGIPAALRTGIWQGETALLTRAQQEIPVMQTIIAHPIPGSSAKTLSSVMQDITEQRRAKQEQMELALQKERMEVIRDLVDTLSHDLKTPLSVIQTSLDLIDRYSDPLRQKDKLQMVREQTNLIHSYIQDMLTVSQLEYRLEETPTGVDLVPLLESVIASLRPKLEMRSIQLSRDFPPDLPQVYADEDGLMRVFCNLLENAIHYTTANGRVTLRLWEVAGGVMAEVIDTGIGIAPEDQTHIFERFYRASNGKGFHQGGTGLGLAIVAKIIQRNRGKIELQSQLGSGSVFRVWLPVAGEQKPDLNL